MTFNARSLKNKNKMTFKKILQLPHQGNSFEISGIKLNLII